MYLYTSVGVSNENIIIIIIIAWEILVFHARQLALGASPSCSCLYIS